MELKFRVITIFIAIISVSICAKGQETPANHNGAVKDSIAKQASSSPLLSIYLEVKDALVKSDATTAAAKAGEFVRAVNGMDVAAMNEAAHKTFMSLKNKLVGDAKKISATKNIGSQREHFKSLSDNVYLLAKAVKLSSIPLYQAYCPMIKASWLSNEKAIKNPYYGNQMLTCGEIKETF